MTTPKERIDELKRLKFLANSYLIHYKDINNTETSKWKNNKAAVAIVEINDLIKRINQDLHSDKINAYCEALFDTDSPGYKDWINGEQTKEAVSIGTRIKNRFRQVSTHNELIELLRFNPIQNVGLDIGWIDFTPFTVQQVIDIHLGDRTEEILLMTFPSTLKRITINLIPFYKEQGKYEQQLSLLEDAISLSDKGKYLSSNIILMALTESITKELCKFLCLKQEIKSSIEEAHKYVSDSFISLESLILKGDWKSDFSIDWTKLLFHFTDVYSEPINDFRKKVRLHKKSNVQFEEELNKFLESKQEMENYSNEALENKLKSFSFKIQHLADNLMNEEDWTIKINLETLLNFLVRKYKDDRNNIVHGNFDKMNTNFKNYIGFSALYRVFEIDQIYRSKYSK